MEVINNRAKGGQRLWAAMAHSRLIACVCGKKGEGGKGFWMCGCVRVYIRVKMEGDHLIHPYSLIV
jgi:hypothetical protein